MTVPEATLGVQITTSKPPKPTGIGVIVAKRLIAVVSLKELRRVVNQVDHMEVAYENSHVRVTEED